MDARHRSHGQAKQRLPRPHGSEALLALPQAQEIIARLATAVDEDYPLRADHVAHVAAVCVRAKFRPNNPHARPTL